jgi:hypothetical protein
VAFVAEPKPELMERAMMFLFAAGAVLAAVTSVMPWWGLLFACWLLADWWVVQQLREANRKIEALQAENERVYANYLQFRSVPHGY